MAFSLGNIRLSNVKVVSVEPGHTAQGTSVVFPIALSESPNTARGFFVTPFPVLLSAQPHVAEGTSVTAFPIGLSSKPDVAQGTQVVNFPILLTQ